MEETLGQRIRRARLGRGLGQAELARAIGLSKTSLSLIETGQVKDPRSSVVQRIARALRVRTDYLLGLSDEVTTYDTSKWGSIDLKKKIF